MPADIKIKRASWFVLNAALGNSKTNRMRTHAWNVQWASPSPPLAKASASLAQKENIKTLSRPSAVWIVRPASHKIARAQKTVSSATVESFK
jgi:hypothetical protein